MTSYSKTIGSQSCLNSNYSQGSKSLNTPCTYLVIGNGRMARHFVQYLKFKNLPFYNWSRGNSSEAELQKYIELADRVLLLISDRSIELFVENHPELKSKFLVHFSGALSFDFAVGAHPLNTFTDQLYSLDVYENTPFVIDDLNLRLSDVLPGLSNAFYHIEKKQKALYHALCVMSGNFTALLWQQVYHKFENDLHLPPHALHAYMLQVAQNLIANPHTALTGPLVRNDRATLEKNLAALSNQPEQNLFSAFIQYHQALSSLNTHVSQGLLTNPKVSRKTVEGAL